MSDAFVGRCLAGSIALSVIGTLLLRTGAMLRFAST